MKALELSCVISGSEMDPYLDHLIISKYQIH